jgi:amino acid adenylation domain-containing protein
MGERSLLSNSETARLLEKWNNTAREYPAEHCLHGLIEERVRLNPNLPAVRFEDREISYAELNTRANQSAHYLRSLGIGPDSIVGVLMERSLEMVIALLGILKAGGAYLPLDPTYPQERLGFMLDDAGVSIVFTQQKYRRLLPDFAGTMVSLDSQWEFLAQESAVNPARITVPDHLAYVIYTSGSTGKPKGCMIPHAAICNRLLWMQDEYRLTDQDRVLQKTPFTFDVSVWEFFWPLLAGACLVMAKPEGHRDSNYLVETISREQITTCHFVPSMLRFFIGNPGAGRCAALRQVFTSGEALPFDLMRDFKRKLPAKLHNLYGPTEAAVDVTYWECTERPDQKVPLGRPIANIRIYILDEQLNQVPVGAAGEIHIGGVGLARGYLGRPELTAEKFIRNPFGTETGDRLYKTGDQGRYLPDGNIEFLGRIDFQVKLRGNRVELGEIETLLREAPGIGAVVVQVKDEDSDDPKLVAYVVGKGDPPSAKQIRELVRSKLPDYMVPNIIVPLPALPVTGHGKLDRAALPWPVKERTLETKAEIPAGPGTSPPENIAAALLDELQKMLDLAGLTLEDDLFDAGATSLTMAQLVGGIQQRYGVTVPVELFLNEPTVAALAGYITQERGRQPRQGGGTGPAAPDISSPFPASNQPQLANETAERLIVLPQVQFRENAYVEGANCRNLTRKELPFGAFSRFMALLKQIFIEDNPKYLYPSAGGLNAVQTYLYLKEGAVAGIDRGIYYYHPMEHALYRVHDRPELDRTIFCEYDRPVFENAGFALFFIAQLAAIKPVYQAASPLLVTLDAGYMGELLLSKQKEFNVGLAAVGGVDFDRIRPFFKLDEEHRFLHCLLGGAPDDRLPGDGAGNCRGQGVAAYLQKTGKRISEHCQDYRDNRTFAAFLRLNINENLPAIEYLNNQEIEAVHKQHLNIRLFSGGEPVITLEPHDFRESDYLIRSCRRDYRSQALSLEQLGKFLALFRPEPGSGQFRYLYPSFSGVYPIRAYLYIKENGVAGLAEGIYAYHPEKHALEVVNAKLSKRVKPSYTPFNRKHYQKSAFCLFLIGQLNALKPVYGDDGLYYALLEAGYLGQLLLDKQAEFDIGICPIGGMDFERIRGEFKLEEGQELLHSFTCGGYEHQVPPDRIFLEAGRGERPASLRGGVETSETRRPEPDRQDLAIIGIGGRYPGAENLEVYWDNLQSGHCSCRELPESRSKLWGERVPLTAGRGGYLNDPDCFDNLLFMITPMEARLMDPQERLMLETVWECLENAGYTAANLHRACGGIGVFIGVMWNDYQNYSRLGAAGRPEVLTAALPASIANRISYFFNFNGPSIALNTSCSSAITAVHLACESVKRGECGAAIAGGVNLLAHPYHRDLLTALELVAPDGECRPFSAQADGWVAGEGVGAVLIKPLAAAERDRDQIHGIIKGTAVGHSGRTVRFGAPHAQEQAESIQKALAAAGVTAESISYVEAAAPGAGIADAAEIDALKSVFSDRGAGGLPCLVGSVKANIGHLESASAMSQIAKVLLQLKNRRIAPTLNSEPRNPLLQLQGSRLAIADAPQVWPEPPASSGADRKPLRALINAFGATGSGGHIVLEEYIPPEKRKEAAAQPVVVPISALTPEQLNRQAALLYQYLTQDEAVTAPLSDIGYTLQTGRAALKERLAMVAADTPGLIGSLAEFLRGKTGNGLYRGTVESSREEPPERDACGDPHSIARQWCRGAAIEWNVLHNGSERKIALPTYPFAKIRHWATATGNTAAPEVAAAQACSPGLPSGNNRDDTILLVKTEDYLKRIFSQVTELALPAISPHAALDQYGIGSVMLKKMNHLLKRDFGELPPALMYECQTLHQLSRFLLEAHREKLERLLNHSGAGGTKFTGTDEAAIAFPRERQNEAEPGWGGRPEGAADIAVIGLSGRYPGAGTIAEFWDNLQAGLDCITEVPPERWDYRPYYHPDKGRPGKTNCKWGGFIAAVDQFDPLFFNLSPRQAELVDPQERLFLETVWNLLESSGYTREKIRRVYQGMVGVYAGAMFHQYHLLEPDPVKRSVLELASGSSIANRVSHFFDWQGPSLGIDTGCSAAAMAVHLACESLKRGECRLAIAGGVNLSIHPQKYLGLSMLQMLGSDPEQRSFGKGDGYLPAEGVGAVLLKPLDEAIADRDAIFAVIKSTAANHSGRTNGFAAPNPNAQARLMTANFRKAGLDPRTVSYVEASANGSAVGDATEIAALLKVFPQDNEAPNYCALGSVKSNIGHPEAASGMAQLAKVVLQLNEGKLVPTLKAEALNPELDLENTPFYLQRELREWQRPVLRVDGEERELPRRAAVSSWGAGGSNVHLILEEYPGGPEEPLAAGTSHPPQVMVFSARDRDRLAAVVAQMLEFLENHPEVSLAPLAYTLQTGREAMELRLALVVRNREELLQGLKAFLKPHQSGAGSENSIPVFTGDLATEAFKLGRLLSGKEWEIILQVIMAEQNYEKLALYWTYGVQVPWESLHQGEAVRKLALPTYPFKKRRCWVGSPPEAEPDDPADQRAGDPGGLAVADPAIRERRMTQLLADQLGLDPDELNPAKSLAEYGVDSITLMQLAGHLQAHGDPSVDPGGLLQCRTMGEIIRALATPAEAGPDFISGAAASLQAVHRQFPELIRLNRSMRGRPVFWLHGAAGGVESYYQIARPSARPFYGIQASGRLIGEVPLTGIRTIADYYRQIIEALQPEGPYDLGGFSIGGMLAYEVARQLQTKGKTVATLVMLDSFDSAAIKTQAGRAEAIPVTKMVKGRILQTVNLMLLATISEHPEKRDQVLIHRDELDLNGAEPAFLEQVIRLAQKRGLTKKETQLQDLIRQAAQFQQAYELEHYDILPLPDPGAVSCYYFLNKSGLFLGELEPYFNVTDSLADGARLEYWKEWEQNLPNFHLLELEASNHWMLIAEPRAVEAIRSFCERLYAESGMSGDFWKIFKQTYGSK